MEKQDISFNDPNEFFDRLVQVCVFKEASDIHILPGKVSVTVKFRMFGELQTMYTFPIELFNKVNNTVKIRALMDISEQHHTQDGKIFMHVKVDDKSVGVNLRVSTLPSLNGENIVIRVLITQSKFLSITSLGFPENLSTLLKKASSINEGLILVCGGTGSGKTTTLYSILNEFNPETKGIYTLENPVEYVVDGYVQSQIHIVNGDKKSLNSYTFAEGLVGILRQDPDVIMIGEMRRKDETEVCLEAANTGHIVMGTIHSNSAIGVIARIRQFDIPSYLIASSLKYIVCQKMIKVLCDHCKMSLNMEKGKIPKKMARHINAETVDVFTNNPNGCEKCNNGYSARTVLAEIIKVDDEIYKMILDSAGENEIRSYLMKNGWVPIYLDGLKRALSGTMNIYDAIKLDN